MSEKKILICVTVFVLVYLVWCAILIYAAAKSRPKAEKKPKFDERQSAAQGMAYKWAFWAILIYYLLYAMVSSFGVIWCDHFLGAFLGIIVGTTVFAVICIFRDAYFRPGQSRKSGIIMLNIIVVSQGMIGVMHLCDGTVIEDGILSGDAVQLFILLLGLILDIAILVKHRMEKQEEQE